MRGNATFTAADLSAGSAGVAALAKKFGGARAIWDAGVCSQTQSHHMCMGPCDAWQPRDAKTQRPLLEPVWVYLLTNTDEPSPKVTPRLPACMIKGWGGMPEQRNPDTFQTGAWGLRRQCVELPERGRGSKSR